jgi:CspA family cold shock protein
MTKRIVGTIKWYNTAKGYGFIGCESGDDVFVHCSSIKMDEQRRIEKGQQVEFSVVKSPKGLQAASVVLR